MHLIHHTIAITTLLLSFATALALPSHTNRTLDLTPHKPHFLLRPHNLTSPSPSPFWECFKPTPRLHPTTFPDCQNLAFALNEFDPSGRNDFLFSPRSVADIHLPFYMRWGTCVLDIRGKDEDSWDIFPIRLLSSAVIDMARSCVEEQAHLGGWGVIGYHRRLRMGLVGVAQPEKDIA